MGKGNGQMVGGRYLTALRCAHSTSYYVLLLLYGRIFDLHRNGIYAILSEGKKYNMNKMY